MECNEVCISETSRGKYVNSVNVDKMRMHEEIMTNDDNLESNLLTSSLLKRHLVYMLVQDELKKKCTGNLPLQVNYAAGRLVAVMVYCFRQ